VLGLAFAVTFVGLAVVRNHCPRPLHD
jgi:hypothetical protein